MEETQNTNNLWVREIGLEAPKGFKVSNSPITYKGNLQLEFSKGYSLPTIHKQSLWDNAYYNSHVHPNRDIIDNITSEDIERWNSDWNLEYKGSIDFKNIKNLPKTIQEHGILNVYTKDKVDSLVHKHHNKDLLDSITLEMLQGALLKVLKDDGIEAATNENVFSALRTLLEISKNNDYLNNVFLSKIRPDTAHGLIKFLQGLEIGDYTSGFLGGGGAFKMNNGISELEVDKLTVRMVATFFEILVSKIRHVGGQILLTPARMKCIKVVEEEEHYRCYFDRGENNEVEQEFIVGDQARCQVFTGSGQKFYWRLVTAVGDDWIQLDKEDCVEGSGIPEIGDDIVQLGHRLSDNIDRMSAIILSTVGSDSPSFKQYKGIQFYTLEGKEITVFSGRGNKIAGDTIFIQDKTLEDIINVQEEDIKKVEQAIEEAEKNIPKPLWNIEAVNIIPDAPAVLFREDNEGNPYTLTLVPKIWRNHEDVTEIMQGATERIFEFERHNRWGIDDKGVTDANWNLAHRGFNQVTLTHEDIMFVGTIYFVINDDILEEQYQILINK